MSVDAGTLRWAAARLRLDAVEDRGPLVGGSTSIVHVLGPRRRYGDRPGHAAGTAGDDEVWVLKQAPPERPAAVRALIEREARILEALAPLDLLVPRVIACDPTGTDTRGPALLMTRMPGTLLRGRAGLRAAIPTYVDAIRTCHREARALIAGRRWRPWFDLEHLPLPADHARAELWRRAIDVVRRFPAPLADGFIHRDPHPANLLYSDGRLTGMLDWANAGRGPRGVDVSRLCLNLACLLDVDATRDLRECYQDSAAVRHDPLLDVYALLESEFLHPTGHPTWRALGIDLDAATIRDRLDAFLQDTLRRMTVRRAH